LIGLVGAAACLAACGGGIGQDTGEARNLPYAEASVEAHAILAVANDISHDEAAFDGAIGLDRRAAKGLIVQRQAGVFTSLAQLYAVPYCKASCLSDLLEYAATHGIYTLPQIDVVFSPQPIESSHLTRVAQLIDGAQETIDIAMYSYSSRDPVRGALERAAERGVAIRFLANSDLAKNEQKSGGLEDMGIDVRRVTKIMHHKYAIVDGPRSDDTLERAASAQVATGSANWSSSAATRYDENTLFFTGYPELSLRLQHEFDVLWAGSKDVVYHALEWDTVRAASIQSHFPVYETDKQHVFLTSANFAPTSSSGWSKLGTTVVTDELVAAIGRATESLQIATGHFVSLPIAQAVVDALAARPQLEVDIVLDCQETSKQGEIGDLKSAIESAGGHISYKCNTYRWHYKYAQQMHHKYMIVDGLQLYTGSLNFSDNAESNSFENMLLFQAAEHDSLIASFEENFALVAQYGHAGDAAALAELEADISGGDTVPLNWYTPISMSLATFGELKSLIRSECPATQSWSGTGPANTYNKHFTQHPEWFATCHKSGYPWPDVPEDQRL
jgi:phosphatidylserine/phosphatidylglycerophosphate/cardiolipin synthase-like enzyme